MTKKLYDHTIPLKEPITTLKQALAIEFFGSFGMDRDLIGGIDKFITNEDYNVSDRQKALVHLCTNAYGEEDVNQVDLERYLFDSLNGKAWMEINYATLVQAIGEPQLAKPRWNTEWQMKLYAEVDGKTKHERLTIYSAMTDINTPANDITHWEIATKHEGTVTALEDLLRNKGVMRLKITVMTGD